MTVNQSPIADNGVYEDNTFAGKPLHNLSITGAEFYNCTFKSCSFTRSTVSRCKFSECTFDSCDFSLCKLLTCTWVESRFSECKLSGIDWTRALSPNPLHISHPSFSKCVLSYSVFFGLPLQEIQIEDCIAHEADFAEADLTNADLRGTDFLKARFHDTNLSRADLRGSLNYEIDPLANGVKGAKVTAAEAIGMLRGLGVIVEM